MCQIQLNHFNIYRILDKKSITKFFRNILVAFNNTEEQRKFNENKFMSFNNLEMYFFGK